MVIITLEIGLKKQHNKQEGNGGEVYPPSRTLRFGAIALGQQAGI